MTTDTDTELMRLCRRTGFTRGLGAAIEITNRHKLFDLSNEMLALMGDDERGMALANDDPPEPLASCDCCGDMRPLQRTWYGLLETFACAKCRGEEKAA